MAASKGNVCINSLVKSVVEFDIVGITPLLVHSWSHKAMQEMLDKQTGKKVNAKHEIKVPVRDFCESLYWITDMPDLGDTDESAEEGFKTAVEAGARFGFRIDGIKKSIITGAYRAGLDVKQTELKGALLLEAATPYGTTELAEIVDGDGPAIPVMREDTVRVGGMSKTADIRYRGLFEEWRIPLRMRYMADGKYSIDQLLNCVNFGGFVVGIGDWRPERNGQFGMYELDTSSVRMLS